MALQGVTACCTRMADTTTPTLPSVPTTVGPECKRLAVYVAVNIEQFRYGAVKEQPLPRLTRPTAIAYSHGDYGNRVGIWRLLDLFDALAIPIEAQMNTAIYEHCPDIPKRLHARSDEILGHGITNSDEQGHLDEASEAELIRTVTETIAKHEGQPPVGWMSPWLSNSEVTLDLLQEGPDTAMSWTGLPMTNQSG